MQTRSGVGDFVSSPSSKRLYKDPFLLRGYRIVIEDEIMSTEARKGGKINSSFSWCFNCYKFSGCIDGCLLPKERGAKGDTSPDTCSTST
ncbi:hypothetical protein AV530_005659 [Patagioenas fasciata monilis]|uniref:Uncharacterized protein n=1 Tax=Patagioenas fasciata monilis TaxID=372326 RepID=A0A1V4JNG8_PATFA|nr:hypothetical protein AV530_005659 [Patagioenas fasciata monilis]